MRSALLRIPLLLALLLWSECSTDGVVEKLRSAISQALDDYPLAHEAAEIVRTNLSEVMSLNDINATLEISSKEGADADLPAKVRIKESLEGYNRTEATATSNQHSPSASEPSKAESANVQAAKGVASATTRPSSHRPVPPDVAPNITPHAAPDAEPSHHPPARSTERTPSQPSSISASPPQQRTEMGTLSATPSKSASQREKSEPKGHSSPSRPSLFSTRGWKLTLKGYAALLVITLLFLGLPTLIVLRMQKII